MTPTHDGRIVSLRPADRVDRILQEAVGRDLSSWERFEFLPSVRQRTQLTERQEKVLQEIEGRVL